jgi:hypothetical protein
MRVLCRSISKLLRSKHNSFTGNFVELQSNLFFFANSANVLTCWKLAAVAASQAYCLAEK